MIKANKLFYSILVVLITIVLLPSIAFAEDLSLQEMFKKFYLNEQKANYIGFTNTISYMGSKKNIIKTKVYFLYPDKNRFEYLNPQLQGMLIIDDGEKICRYNPVNKCFVLTYVNPLNNRNDGTFKKLLQNYKIEPSGEDIIAKRKTFILKIVPEYNGNLSQKIWLDKEYFTPLKTELYNSSGKLISCTEFTEINYNVSVENSMFDISNEKIQIINSNNETRIAKNKLENIVGFKLVRPSYVPGGYQLEGLYLSYCRNGFPQAHLRYFDGLNNISLFEKGFQGNQLKCPNRKKMGKGGKHLQNFQIKKGQFENIVSLTSNDIMFVFIGAIDENELKKMAESIK